MSEQEDKAPEASPAKRQPRKRRLLSVGAVALVIAVAIEGVWHRQSQEKAVAAWTDAAAIPAVDLVHPTKGAPQQQVVLRLRRSGEKRSGARRYRHTGNRRPAGRGQSQAQCGQCRGQGSRCRNTV